MDPLNHYGGMSRHQANSLDFKFREIYELLDIYSDIIDKNTKDIELLKYFHNLITLYIIINSILILYVFIKYYFKLYPMLNANNDDNKIT
jgi:hypothetical protein